MVRGNPFLGLDYELAFQGLGDGFFDVVTAAEFPQQILRFRNDRLLPRLGLEGAAIADEDFVRAFGRFEGREPLLAMRYHGYQFGEYNPRLGDGRGFLYGQVRGVDGVLWDLGTKGSGTTPYSRGGDGRLTLKGGVREVLASELLGRLGVTTSRCLSLVETGEKLWRGDEPSPTRSSVMVRMGQSHVRFGTFERHHHEGRRDRVQALLNHVIEVYYPHLLPATGLADEAPEAVAVQECYGRFYGELVERVARLCAQWMAAGFCHAVLNTDNMLVTGESFDYGPYGFIPTYDLRFTAAYFDYYGRYAYGNQPGICHLNLELLQRPLGMVIDRAALETGLAGFEEAYHRAYRRCMVERLGLPPCDDNSPEGEHLDDDLVEATVQFLALSQVHYGEFFAALRSGFSPAWRGDVGAIAAERPFWSGLMETLPDAEAMEWWGRWCEAYHRRLQDLSTEEVQGVAVRLRDRNSLVSLVRPQIEAVWEAIDQRDDWGPFQELVARIWE
ncbi:MAG: YdiU family protein [Cyanobacteria bacterium]|nr:YdiU family protein [Cyanobacteriota bacterium]